VALLHQVADDQSVGFSGEPIVLGVQNLGRAEVEAVDSDNEDPSRLGDFAGVRWDGWARLRDSAFHTTSCHAVE
jgi:hypothetical protein